MWKIENSLQFIAFLTCTGFGALYCFLYDILRAVRKNKRFSDWAVAVQDLLFFIFAALITFLLLLKYTYGEIRLYIFIAIIIGFSVFRVTLSRFITPILIKAISKIIMLISVIFRGYKAIKNKIAAFIGLCAEKIKKYCKNSLKNLKNHLQHNY